MRSVLVPSGAVTVAELEGQVAGFVAAVTGWLEHLYVDPAAQGRGVGSALFAHAQAAAAPRASTSGCSSATPALAF